MERKEWREGKMYRWMIEGEGSMVGGWEVKMMEERIEGLRNEEIDK